MESAVCVGRDGATIVISDPVVDRARSTSGVCAPIVRGNDVDDTIAFGEKSAVAQVAEVDNHVFVFYHLER